MKMQKIAIIAIAGFLALLTATMFIPQVYSIPLFSPVVVTFDSSNGAVKNSTSTILEMYPNARVIKYEDSGSLLNVLTLMRSHSQLIIIGHGSTNGILSAKEGIIPWQKIAEWINSLPNTDVYFLSCNSYTASKLVNVPSLGFLGAVDGPIAAYQIAIRDALNHNNIAQIYHVVPKFVQRYNALSKGAKSEYMMPILDPGDGGGSSTPPPSTPQPINKPAEYSGSCTLQPNDPLYYSPPHYLVDCLGSNEGKVRGLNILMLIFAILMPLTAAVAIDMMATAWYVFVAGSYGAEFLYGVYNLFLNVVNGNSDGVINWISWLIPALFAFATAIYQLANWILKITLGSSIVVDEASLPVKVAVLGPAVAVALGAAIFEFYNLQKGLTDTNDSPS